MDGQLKQLLDVDVQTEFRRIVALLTNSVNVSPPAFEYGNLTKNENSAPPRILWSSPSGQFDPGKGAAGVSIPGAQQTPGIAPIGTIVPRLELWVWGTDEQSCWDMFRMIAMAIRNVVGGPNSRYRDYQESSENDEKWTDNGRILVVHFDIDLVLYAQLTQERAIKACTGHEHQVFLNTTLGDEGSDPLP